MLPFELTKDTPYLALSGELWSVFYEYFNRNWPCYKGFLLYCSYHSLVLSRQCHQSPLLYLLVSDQWPHERTLGVRTICARCVLPGLGVLLQILQQRQQPRAISTTPTPSNTRPALKHNKYRQPLQYKHKLARNRYSYIQTCCTNPTMHESHIPQCSILYIRMGTCVNISVMKCCIAGYLFNALWDLWDGSITFV